MSVGDDPSRAEYGAPSPEGTAGLLGAARRTARRQVDTGFLTARAYQPDEGRRRGSR